MKALIYARVSTKEQAETGYSLESQEKECRNFAFNQGYEVDRVFIERGESAKTTDRTELQHLIKYAYEKRKEVSSIMIWKYDRLSRSLADQMDLVREFSALGIRILSATENNDDNSVGRLMRNIIGAFAQYENDVKSERAVNGMKQALQQGRWCWKVPLGYRQSRDEGNKPKLVPTEEAKFIQEAYKLASTALHNQFSLISKLNQLGFYKLTEKNLLSSEALRVNRTNSRT